ncbi:hypothetical protein E2C01_063418 [Portunus trituberculatus]|uniref:Uncharacterized protein n=1 Tax=Portunus trituberculatus TaxID=210409 RepID=A0A5B7HGB2_PORTR|nr:hypothetical protein [Portunus trituberculatus]
MARVPGYLPVPPRFGVPLALLLDAAGFGDRRAVGKHGGKLTLQGQNMACLGGRILRGDGTHRRTGAASRQGECVVRPPFVIFVPFTYLFCC